MPLTLISTVGFYHLALLFLCSEGARVHMCTSDSVPYLPELEHLKTNASDRNFIRKQLHVDEAGWFFY